MDQYVSDLTGEMLLFGTLSKVLYASPQKEWIQSLMAEKVFDEIPFGAGQADAARGLSLIQNWNSAVWDKDPSAAFSDLETDYLNLFIGAGKVLAPPWESVYSSEERLVFQEETLQVRAWYRRYGLQSEQLYHEPDDHIGLELSFLAYLSQMALTALDQENEAVFSRLLGDQHAFLTEHPLRWTQAWCDLVNQHARTDFYRGVALLVNGALKESDSFLQDAVSQLSEGTDTV